MASIASAPESRLTSTW